MYEERSKLNRAHKITIYIDEIKFFEIGQQKQTLAALKLNEVNRLRWITYFIRHLAPSSSSLSI